MTITERRDGFIVDRQIARKYHDCAFCNFMIDPREEYFSIIKGGGGLGWIKYPDRVHLHCLESYFRSRKHD
jgi:hypothetical protein